MPQLQNLVLTDRAATPVAHTFIPRAIDGNVATVTESSGTPIGDNKVSLSMAKTSAGRYKAVVKMAFPIVQTETINGVSRPVVVRTAYADANFNFDASSTEAERNNVVGMFADAFGIGKVLVNDTVVKLQGIY